MHVGVADPCKAIKATTCVRAGDAALAAKCTYWEGRDTGYASGRTFTWRRQQVAGPPPYYDYPAISKTGLLQGWVRAGFMQPGLRLGS